MGILGKVGELLIILSSITKRTVQFMGKWQEYGKGKLMRDFEKCQDKNLGYKER